MDKQLLQRFLNYHEANPHVYKRFLELAIEMRMTGKKKYSSWFIINRIRWDFDISTKGDVFKINNDFIALYARMVMWNYPDLKGFFSLRGLKPVRKKSLEQIAREEGA